MLSFIRFLAVSLLLASSSLLAQPLLEAHQAAALLADGELQAVDIRSPELYQQEHIPGAISAPYGRWRGPASNPGQLLSPHDFEQLVQELGLTPEQHILVYSTGDDETDFGAAARVYWTLKYLGFERLSVLNGGFKYWLAGQAGSTEQAARQLPASLTRIQLQPQLAVGTDELFDKISRQQGDFQLLDSRPPAFFEGTVKAPTATVGGTIAGARNLPFQQWFNTNDTRIRPAAEIRQLVREQQLTEAGETLSFCNTGHWAATNWFVLSELAGLDNVRLYPGSMAEWTQNPAALPMANTPGRWQQIKAKFQQLVQ
ncbi:sulfurtransferase [Thiopseudomonas denitrificans]|uniref:Thiosulfate/3-mercaptopyruvate sulfurtransferase n=1 Tax=Thiopseudomonas denitrificans TaxID=1501432 RepID=A0A4R6U6F0_9GAMM|nr:sulfurtransferase [Thiopseudomonas denitrificans]TDQ40105.1 thiosulfate/3-mercaptopyruvate sulfurtransferase [Thiopseudomonas denitrificans]